MKPVKTLRDGAIGLSIWERTGSRGPFFEFTISRSFKDKDGKTAYSGSFRDYDADSIRLLIGQAVEHIRGRNASNGGVTMPAEAIDENGKATGAIPVDTTPAGGV